MDLAAAREAQAGALEAPVILQQVGSKGYGLVASRSIDPGACSGAAYDTADPLRSLILLCMDRRNHFS